MGRRATRVTYRELVSKGIRTHGLPFAFSYLSLQGVLMTQPKKRNLDAKKPSSRHKKIRCDECNQEVSVPSLKAHYALLHRVYSSHVSRI